MQLFGLSSDPEIAAALHCDKHLSKLTVEAVQLLTGALDIHGCREELVDPYKVTHSNHPLMWWVAACVPHFEWTLKLGIALAREHERRRSPHKSLRKLLEIHFYVKKGGYPLSMPRAAPSAGEWKNWVYFTMGYTKLERKGPVVCAVDDAPQGCEFGILCMPSNLHGGNWVQSYHRCYADRMVEWEDKYPEGSKLRMWWNGSELPPEGLRHLRFLAS